jgi:alkanesulfonate monooxygenase SsuD/methylene tetrahydromethanopterin reductase-like flavin-dependent oxidoreductase (luciferase family)
VAIVGTASEVAAQVRRLADIGCTDFCGAPFGSGDQVKATLEVLAGLVAG